MLDPLVLSMGVEEFGQSRLTLAVIFILIFILSVSRVLSRVIHSFVCEFGMEDTGYSGGIQV